MAKQLAFHFDSSVCNGCKACVIACKSKNALPVDVNYRHVYEYGGGGWVADPLDPAFIQPNNIFVYSLSIACMHCENPACVDVCPAKAIEKRDDGIVVVDSDKCIGCHYCSWACPYGAPQFDPDEGTMQKCDMCADVVDEGGKPYCVAACPMRALDFGELEELRAQYGTANEVAPLPPADITNPSFVMTPHRHAQPVGSKVGRVYDDEV
ncbi:MAG TPA: dimethylsulfoxide reductase subunit B [Aggregatilinea sp.]|jgi:anaerobic dimethyl sulfoxide reductase subunit B (iron-sulfur subunit)|uniref:DMSO/selenate family reductase complex B subunit n=1 Tax=Aggregatilinea sp. TaxID=2806333 RepID=UPI002BE4B795|nr:DMSO/selenate family reductase complex B subunit [Aggregatilinea sp.]HML20549.1 dimethylsulfoxide reductase subunit B [Aggregatilinea sp.]